MALFYSSLIPLYDGFLLYIDLLCLLFPLTILTERIFSLNFVEKRGSASGTFSNYAKYPFGFLLFRAFRL